VARLLAELTPGRLERCFRAVGGTEAVEIALQLARAYTGRHRVIAIADAYHGNSTAAKALERPIRPPLDERALHRLERVLAAGEVAALIMEPIITNLGVEVPTAEFMTGMASRCAKHRTLVIADEVATGFGRTGTVFACEQYGLVPDVLCLAKALTNGAAPMGATITTATIADKASRELAMYSTYGWHPLACEAALEVLETWRRDETVLLAQVAERSEQFQQRLLAMRMPAGTAVRIRGLAIGIDLPEGAEAATVIDACLERGLVIAGEDNQLTLFPALTIDRGTADAGLDILQSCFER
jgi:4-aminobutyrate aminotransferase-like enzyme